MESSGFAGVEGVGPSSQVLETRILPLNYTPRLGDHRPKQLAYFNLLTSLCAVCLRQVLQCLVSASFSGVSVLLRSER